MALGPFAATLILFHIAKNGTGWFSKSDIAFAIIILGMAFGRWLEFRGGHPLTCDGEAATASHLKRYILGLALLASVGWAAANILGNHRML